MRKIAIVGATGIVGEKLTQILSTKSIEGNFTFYAGDNGTDRKTEFRNRIYKIKNAAEVLNDQPDYAVFTATNEVSANLIPRLKEQGCVSIDNSSAFRMSEDVPLVIPSVNGETIGLHKIIANPNCTTIQIAVAVAALKKLSPIKVTAVTYQAVSGAGRDGVTDLFEKHGYGRLKTFPHPIYDNVIPAIGSFDADGFTEEEHKVMREMKKILGIPLLKVNCFAARVPVSTGHGVFANVVFEKEFDLHEVKVMLKKAQNVLVFDDGENNLYPMPLTVRGTPFVSVGRITRDPSRKNALNCFIAADNLLRGAAYNAYEILEQAVQNNENTQK